MDPKTDCASPFWTAFHAPNHATFLNCAPRPRPHTPSQSVHPHSGLCNLISDCTLHPGPHTPPLYSHGLGRRTPSQTTHSILPAVPWPCITHHVPDHTPHLGPCTPTLDHASSSQTENPILDHATHPTVLPDPRPRIIPLLDSHPIPVHPHSVSCIHSGPFIPAQTTHPILDYASHPQLCTPILHCTPSYRTTNPNLELCPLLPKSPSLPILTALLQPPRGAIGTHRCGSRTVHPIPPHWSPPAG